MHDTLRYFAQDPIHRKYHHNELTFRAIYAFSENFVLPLSHDEVVHGKGSLLGKMPGDAWQKFANLRLLLRLHVRAAGQEAAVHGRRVRPVARVEPRAEPRLAPARAADDHAGMQRLVGDLNRVYADEPALHELDFDPAGFEWIDADDAEQRASRFMRTRTRIARRARRRRATSRRSSAHNYRVGVPRGGLWREILNSDAPTYGGSGQRQPGRRRGGADPVSWRKRSVTLTLPPLGALSPH